MGAGSTVFSLRSDVLGAFDGSAKGIGVSSSQNVRALKKEAAFSINRGYIELARHRDLDNLQSFTIEAVIRPKAIGGERQNILEAQSPAVALFVDPNGKLVGSIHTAGGWVGVDSGSAVLVAGKAARVMFTRDAAGKLELRIDGTSVGSKAVPGQIQNVGEVGFKIGAWVDGQRFPFVGEVSDVQIRQGVIGEQLLAQKTASAQRIAQAFKAKTGLTRVVVNVLPDHGNSRLQPIKDIMNAAGVQKLSDLQTLKVNVRTVMTPGKVLIAARKSAGKTINWGKIAAELTTGNVAAKRELMARVLPNRNSSAVLKRLEVTTSPPAPSPVAPVTRIRNATMATPVRTGGFVATPFRPTVSLAPISAGRRVTGLPDAERTGLRVPAEALRENPTLRLAGEPQRVAELFEERAGRTRLLDQHLVENLQQANPIKWAVTSQPAYHLHTLKTIPVNSAVMIGETIDLTNIELVIEPSVSTLYIIAERLICGANAKITWRRPGGTTPPRLDDPGLNGRGWSGVHTKPSSRDGLDGEDGRDGAPGIDGSHGLRAPNLEIWVKDMSAMPNLDLNGEDGRQGGVGQRGGRGGNGADGHVGHRYWLFGWHCDTDPGDGGDGGDGGRGGRGGRGGNGGNGGKITVAVLEDTLESTVTNRAFKIKNQGGQRGRGGAGGAGGAGGRGGHSGVGETCKDANDGHNGAQGQPGTIGADGSNLGFDGEISFYEFSLDEWDALLTRPWLSEVSPVQAFPGDRMTLRGSRFSAGDRVIIAGFTLSPTINPDESISITVPTDIGGGMTSTYVRRQDGTESNRYNVWIKPQLNPFSGILNPGATVSLSGRAFLSGASVLVDGSATPATVRSPQSLEFTMPGTGGGGSAGGSVALQVRNPDGLVSNSRTATIPRILEIPFRYGTHNLAFGNFKDGVPDWGTYEDTYGTAEVWHELLDPVFGHPILTGAFYAFYHHFLKGKDRGGLATGFCTSLASLVADKFWLGETDATTITKASKHKFLTALHGKLLSRESLIHFHDQGRQGIARVEATAREIEATFLRGCDRQNAPLLFFIPSGAVWDGGYFDKLSDSHCVMPYRFAYPVGHPGPQLAPGGATTLSSLDGVEMFVWDCNEPTSPECRLVFRMVGGSLEFDYFANSASAKFRSQDGITLGMMTNGAYHLSDHDLPFSGPLGLTSFVLDFLLSPADLQVLDPNGLRTGNFGGQIFSEIPDSHPCYLVPGAYMLPTATALTRRITGTAAGTYTFNSIVPNVGSLVLEDVATSNGQTDVLAASEDATQIRFTPAAEKTFQLTMARQVGSEARAIAVLGAGGGPAADVDITVSPDLSVARVGNRGAARNVEIRGLSIDRKTNTPVRRNFAATNLPADHDLLIAVQDWATLNATVQAVSFE